jgi:hypothetical protein
LIKKRLVDLVFAVVAIVAGGALLYAWRQHETAAANAAAQNQTQAAADYAEGGGLYQSAELSALESLFGGTAATTTTAGISGNTNTDGGVSTTGAVATGTGSGAVAQGTQSPAAVIVQLPIVTSSSSIGPAAGNI